MSDETQSAEATSPAPAVTYEVNEFRDGDFKGFKFYTPEYHNVDKLREDFGDEAILALANQQLISRIRTKVKNELPEVTPANRTATMATVMAANPGGVLFTESRAKEWRPDVREMTVDQMARKAAKLFKEGKIQEGIAMLQKAQGKAEEEKAASEATAEVVAPTA